MPHNLQQIDCKHRPDTSNYLGFIINLILIEFFWQNNPFKSANHLSPSKISSMSDGYFHILVPVIFKIEKCKCPISGHPSLSNFPYLQTISHLMTSALTSWNNFLIPSIRNCTVVVLKHQRRLAMKKTFLSFGVIRWESQTIAMLPCLFNNLNVDA